ncbi:MAG: hypothetical protein A4S09_00770 [Proteobacteria bacterium SG_bin7]|nr:MAG: hypothetical protein A4S09_00770 [Proteobacteria bacterium SG_bin7]
MNLEQFKSPYGIHQSVNWLWRFFRGGDFKNPENIYDVAKSVTLRETNHDCQLIFVGDLMGTTGKKIRFSDSISSFVKGCDFLIANLEGPLIDKDDIVFVKQYNHPRFLSDLDHLLPLNKWVFGLANNHVFDYGEKGLTSTCRRLEESGSQYFGLRYRPTFSYSGIHVVGATEIQNWPCSHVMTYRDLETVNDPQKTILFLHWGKEFEFYPKKDQTSHRQIKYQRFPKIIGHHSHTPQPIEFINNSLTAYSLGNLYIYFNKKMLRYGKILKLSFSKSELVKIEWQWTFTELVTDKELQVGLIDECPLFS